MNKSRLRGQLTLVFGILGIIYATYNIDSRQEVLWSLAGGLAFAWLCYQGIKEDPVLGVDKIDLAGWVLLSTLLVVGIGWDVVAIVRYIA